VISEPEMTEGVDPPESREVMADLVQRPPARSLRRRPWLWPALGGASVASALWAAAVLLLNVGDQSPDLRGYRLDRDSCKSARLASLQEELALKSVPNSVDEELLKHPALDQVHCSLGFQKKAENKPGGHWQVSTTVGVAVALHKATDPRDEFDADRRVTDLGVVAADNVKPVPDLGDEAFLIVEDFGHTELRVLDGAAVVTLSLSTTTFYEGDMGTAEESPELPDVSTYWPAMISDMRELMADFRRS